MKDAIRETLAFSELTPEEKQKRGILGRLYGPIADIVNPTRNGRTYTEELWEKVFNENEIVKELLARGGIPGELDHPKDREDTDPEKIAIIMPEAPKRDSNNHLIGYFDIQDTPCGKIAYQLAKYGFELGISSRGQGELLGDDSVDPDSYDFKCFDLVLIPSVKDARLKMVESLDTKALNLKKALTESLNSATVEEKKLMEETLEHLDINIKDINADEKGINSEKSADIKTESKDSQTNSDKAEEAKNDGSEEIIKNLQEALEGKAQLEAKLKSLQEQLAVSDVKVKTLNEECSRLKDATVRLSSIAHDSKALNEKVSNLEKELKVKDQTIENHQQEIQKLNESKNSNISKVTLNESLTKQKDEFESQIKKLTESLENEKTNSSKQKDEMTQKLNKSLSLKESYKKLANQAVDKFISIKAKMLGVTAADIKSKLTESYTFEDIEKACDSLQEYELNMNKLPFTIDRKVKIKVNESQKDLLHPVNHDDDIDVEYLDAINPK